MLEPTTLNTPPPAKHPNEFLIALMVVAHDLRHPWLWLTQAKVAVAGTMQGSGTASPYQRDEEKASPMEESAECMNKSSYCKAAPS